MGTDDGLRNKVVAVTGASSRIGEATAFRLAASGAAVVLGARRAERLAQVAARIETRGGRVAFAVTDVKERDDLADLVSLALERFGKLDALVNNAGIAPLSSFDDLRVDEWDEMIDVNIKGVLYGIAAALPVFRRQGFGQFVTIASTAALRTRPTGGVYSATKGAVRLLCEALRQEAADTLRVTIVTPGTVRTELADSMTQADAAASTRKAMDEIGIPADAIARAVAFAIEQPANVDVNEIVVRPTAQG
jgi:NADP-dependent 3-hydroxy acid dehydrogenase YdfG